MAAIIISGTEVSKTIKAELKDEVSQLLAKGVTPCLATILVGEDEASKVYVGQKVKTCERLGITSMHNKLPVNVQEPELLNLIDRLNKDKNVHGILCQLPLPKHINADKVLLAISPDKDVDGFHLLNMGKLLSKKNMKEIEQEGMYLPCTPHGIIQLLKRSNININGAEAVIVGRSNIVGKPAALLLMAENATVTICTSKTQDLAKFTRDADILVVATGRPKMITGDMIKPGAAVIDVGINRMENGKLCGDVDFESAKEVAGCITPVPGGVGPMTITMLVANTVQSAERAAK